MKPETAVGVIMITVFVLFVFLVIWTCFGPFEIRYSRELVAFSGDSNISGNFFLFGGSIRESYVYRYLYKIENGGIRQDYEYAKYSTIYETNESPRLEMWSDDRGMGDYQYRFYIPKGSVKNNYELDISK